MDPDTVTALRAVGSPDGPIGLDGRVPHGSSDDPTLLDFSANTNPDTPPGTAGVFEDAFQSATAYPDDGYPEFRESAAEFAGCRPEQIVPTAGGLEAIRLAVGTTVRAGQSVLLPAPSFGEYAREVRLQGGEPTFADHDRILSADPAEHAMVVVCNPNNPTGECYDPDRLRMFADRCSDAGTTLLVDEAFLGFTDHESMAGRDDCLVARSLTKLFGLPGIRMGYAVGTGDALDRLSTARRAWSMSVPAAVVGTHCYGATEFIADTRERVRGERKRVRARLDGRFEVAPSDAPFLLCRVTDDVDSLLSTAMAGGIAVRDARTFRGLDSHIRIAVRTAAENDRLLDVLDV